MKGNYPYVNRDVSWLSFNMRVLQEAIDPSVPLFERIKFLAIYSSNLGEFFKVRVAHSRNLIRVGKKAAKDIEIPAEERIKEILKIISTQVKTYSDLYDNSIVPELRKHGIHMLQSENLNQEQAEFCNRYFEENLLPYVQPILLVKRKIRPFLNNASLYLAIQLRTKVKKHKSGGGASRAALLNIPAEHVPRFIVLPSSDAEQHHMIILDDLIRNCMHRLFPGYDIIDSFSIKLTRDAELYIDDEYAGDLVEKIKKSLLRRDVNPPSRFVYDRRMPRNLRKSLVQTLELERADLIAEGRYHNKFDFFHFPYFGKNHLRYDPLPPLDQSKIDKTKSIFDLIEKKDQLLFFPFQSYRPVIRFFKEAATDSKVTHIRVVQYRVAKRSKIMEALILAAEKGKSVTVFVEVKARFDEERNLQWAERLEAAGIQVLYSFPGLKVHSKLALITKKTKAGEKHFGYFSTGNFNEDTAKVYSDFGLFTFDKRLTNESLKVFKILETARTRRYKFDHLLVGQYNLRSSLNALIDQEIKNAKGGKKAEIFIKANSLEDRRIIKKLYAASEAGVKIKLIIRGICSLVPGVEGYSKNIRAISIVDRYLEHARVFMFHNDGNEKVFLSSADLMERNLSWRIEVAFPVYDKKIIRQIKRLMRIQWSDNVKARLLNNKQKNRYVKKNRGKKVQSQNETYNYLKSLQQ